jgi:dephospho-CoA kinase
MILAVTGYIGTGKTTAAQILKEMGWKVIDADAIGHELLAHPEVKSVLLAKHGARIADRKMQIDRKKLSQIVFGKQEELKLLNRLVHPLLIARLKEIAQTARKEEGNRTVIDAALYNELGLDKVADKVILIEADFGIVCERLKNRYSQAKLLSIMNSQSIPKSPDFRIGNNVGIEQLKQEIAQIVRNQ